jgi:ABC-type lipoprotein release transport system permease subunit
MVETMLLTVRPRDAVTFIMVPAVLVLVGIAACWVPAHWAARVDPAVALRTE